MQYTAFKHQQGWWLGGGVQERGNSKPYVPRGVWAALQNVGGRLKVFLNMQVALGDRPISITMARMWAALRWHEKARLLGSLLWSGLRPMPAEAVKQEIEAMKVSHVLSPASIGYKEHLCCAERAAAGRGGESRESAP